MSATPYIPAATADKLAGQFPKGTRHQAKIDIAIPLIGNGLPPSAVAATLRDKFPEASQKEIDDVVQWAADKNPAPSGYGTASAYSRPTFTKPAPAVKPATRSPGEQCRWFMGEVETTPETMIAASPIAFAGNPAQELQTFLETLYGPAEKLNIVCKFFEREGKAVPQGGGKTLTRLEWVDYITKKGVPQSEAGAWLRPNPCNDGSGKDGSITDGDVTAHRFVLVESDAVPVETQLALYARLKLPIAAVILSGGKSAHAWVRVDAPDAASYDLAAKRLFEILAPYGVDKANKNPSRLSRLPGSIRAIGSTGDGAQRLLHLAHHDTGADLDALESQLKIPIAEEKPLRDLMVNSLERFSELYNNRGKLGVQVGFRDFDFDTGGFKPGQMTVIAAGTNQGKSTVALNIVNGALHNGHGVALFTLEMDREEIADLLVSNNCRVNRNCFNTGFFEPVDMLRIQDKLLKIGSLPLWIYDEASMTVDDIRARVELLKSEKKISLVVIDYVQIVTHPDARTPREQQVAEIARGIRILAKETKLPFVILSQLNDEGKLRESRVVAHEAHNVVILEPNNEQTLMVMKVVKGRRIMKKDYTLQYEPEFARVFCGSPIDERDVPRR